MNLLEFYRLILELDFQYLYGVRRWKFICTMKNSCTYWSEFVQQLDVQFHEFHEALHIAETYSTFRTNCSVVASIYRHCESRPMCWSSGDS